MNKENFLSEVRGLLKKHGFKKEERIEHISSKFYELLIMSNPFVVLEAQKNHDDYSKYHTWPC